jgi:hypothetical protein
VAYMVSQPQAASKVPAHVAPVVQAPAYGPQKRWPLTISIFGALAVSLVLWAGIMFGVAWLIGLIG